MNDQRSDDDRRADEPGPQETDERTRGPQEAPDPSTESATEPEAASHEADAAGQPEHDADPGGAGDGPESGGEGSGDGGAEAAGGPPRQRRAQWIIALALLIALAAAGAAGYLGWRLYGLEQRVASIPAEREAQRAAALEPLAERSALQGLERQLGQRIDTAVDDKAKALISARDEALAEVRQRLATVESGVADIRELAARDQIDWRMAEIRYLLAIAQRRVLIDRDTRSAIAALESADRAISDFGDVRLLPLRQRIVDDLAALRSVEGADIEGIALRLQNLLGRVPDLPAAGSLKAVKASMDNGSDGWWDAMRARLDRYVTVRRREAGPEQGRPRPATSLPEGDSLVLALESARRSALARDSAAYQRALKRAAEALDSGFAADASATERFHDGLARLREQPVEVDLPDLTPTVELAEKLSARIESSGGKTPADNNEAED